MAAVKTVKPRIDVRQAASAAAAYFKNLFPGVMKFSLEEAELSEDECHWLITLGYEARSPNEVPKTMLNSLEDVILGPPKTKYKVFKVDSRTGEVVAMKIRAIG